MPDEVDRRPIAARSAWWAQSLASSCLRAGLQPNQVSLLSVAVAAGGGILFFVAADASPPVRIGCLIGAAVCIQLRLLCNMLDGMIAVEGGLRSKLGALFNELPDRVADTLFLVLAGYASASGEIGIELGWAAALLSVLTAYIRAFGAAQGLPQDFCGPMAKQHRMFTLTIASLIAAVETGSGCPPRVMMISLVLIVIGAAATCVRRTGRLAKALESRPE